MSFLNSQISEAGHLWQEGTIFGNQKWTRGTNFGSQNWSRGPLLSRASVCMTGTVIWPNHDVKHKAFSQTKEWPPVFT